MEVKCIESVSYTHLYVFVFSIMVIPFTWKYGIWGFAYAILAVNLFRFFYVFILMASKIHKKEINSYKLG